MLKKITLFTSKEFGSLAGIIAAGEVTTKVLPEGTRIDRYGSDFGTYTSPEGTPYELRRVK